MKRENKINISLLAIICTVLLISFSSCKKQLDINSDPSNPDNVEAALWLPHIETSMAVDLGFDARFVGRYEQFFQYYGGSTTWDLMGYDAASDNGAYLWRMLYFDMGQNLNMMLDNATKAKQWDYVGVGKALWVWGWLICTDYFGPLAVKLQGNASPSITEYDYDPQEYVYQTVFSLCDTALSYLNRTDGGVSQANLSRGDLMYNGDRSKWIKFVYGVKARAMQSLSNKSSKYYNADSVIAWVNRSFVDNTDNAQVPFLDQSSSNANFLSPTRGNFPTYRQSAFVVQLMDGTVFGTQDPRISKMLVTDMSGIYRGVSPNAGDTGYSSNSGAWRLKNLYNKNANSITQSDPGQYVFAHVPFPIMTYAELQFCKAEAAYKKGDPATALAAYATGIKGHMVFCGLKTTDPGPSAFLNNPNVIPTDPNNLTLSMIMCQKFIALWGHGYVEAWTDLRKYHYTDIDPKTGGQVFANFTPPSPVYTDNQGKLVYRVRPRYNSEYVWNLKAIQKIGADKLDYHTQEMWYSQPD